MQSRASVLYCLANALQGRTGEAVRSVSELRASGLLPAAGATGVTFKRVSEATEQAVARAVRVTL
jgi:hypothetical protein